MEKYNGYSNYETWAVCRWLDNDEGSQEYLSELVKDILTENNLNMEIARRDLAEAIKALVYDSMPVIPNSLYSDLLDASLSEVNWYEIVEKNQE